MFYQYIFELFFTSFIVLWYVSLLLFRILGLEYHIITNDSRRVDITLDNIQKSSISTTMVHKLGKDVPHGVFFGLFYIGYIKDPVATMYENTSNQSVSIHLLCTKASYEYLLTDVSVTRTVESRDITILERYGNYLHIYFNNRVLVVNKKFEPTEIQKNIIYDILDLYNKNDYVTSFVEGKINCGKTTLGMLLALQLNGTLCKSFAPTEPNNNLASVIKIAKPKKSKPLILLLDEADVMISDIHNNKIILNNKIPISVYNKRTYNQFMDDIFLNPYIIILMTSNTSKTTIDSWDPAYLRENRVNLTFIM